MEQRQSFQQMVLEQLDIHMPPHPPKKFRHRPYTFHKNWLKKDLRTKYKMHITLGIKTLITYFPIVIGLASL